MLFEIVIGAWLIPCTTHPEVGAPVNSKSSLARTLSGLSSHIERYSIEPQNRRSDTKSKGCNRASQPAVRHARRILTFALTFPSILR